MNTGIVYAVSRPEWMEECLVSAQSAKAVMPDVKRELYVTKGVANLFGETCDPLFDEVIVLKNLHHPHRPRFEASLQTKLDRAIFVDTDTYFAEPVYELFSLLEHYDLAASMAPQYLHPKSVETGALQVLPEVSEALPEWNTGVLPARVTPKFRDFVSEWLRLFGLCRELDYNMDQTSFRSAVSHSDLRIATLPNNYNFRANLPQIVVRKVKILHAHGQLVKIATGVNQNTGRRFYRPDQKLIDGFAPKAALNTMANVAQRKPIRH